MNDSTRIRGNSWVCDQRVAAQLLLLETRLSVGALARGSIAFCRVVFLIRLNYFLIVPASNRSITAFGVCPFIHTFIPIDLHNPAGCRRRKKCGLLCCIFLVQGQAVLQRLEDQSELRVVRECCPRNISNPVFAGLERIVSPY
jgi:hypothetical protein